MTMQNSKLKSGSNAQEMQDVIFRKMSAEKKLKMADEFFQFAKILKRAKQQDGKHKTANKAGKNF